MSSKTSCDFLKISSESRWARSSKTLVSRDHRGDDSTSFSGRTAVREAEAHALKLSRSCALRHGHDKHGDDGGSFALHTRRFSTESDNGTEIGPTQGYVTITPLPNAPKRKKLQAIAYKKV